jgi:hypothetical protein
VAIDVVDDIDDDTKRELQKIGVTTVNDIERMERSNVDLKRASSNVNYNKLAGILNRTKRRQNAPSVAKAMLVRDAAAPVLALEGANLATAASVGDFPMATLNATPVRIVNASAREVRIALEPGLLRDGERIPGGARSVCRDHTRRTPEETGHEDASHRSSRSTRCSAGRPTVRVLPRIRRAPHERKCLGARRGRKEETPRSGKASTRAIRFAAS